jgi:hypothetical protein
MCKAGLNKGDKGLDMVGQTIEAMSLPQQEVSCRADGVGRGGHGRHGQNLNLLPPNKIHYRGAFFDKNHYFLAKTGPGRFVANGGGNRSSAKPFRLIAA